MDKLSAGLKANLLQHLLRSSQGAGVADAARATGSSARIEGNTLSQLLAANLTPASNTQINLPPALRQLLAEHAQLHQLLPQLRGIQGMLSQPVPGATASQPNAATTPQVSSQLSMQLLAKLVPALTQQLAGNGQPLAASHIRSLVSQWFSFHPGQALTAPPPAQNATWLSQLGPLLQWLLVQRSSNQPLASLLQQATQGSSPRPATSLPATALASLSSLLLGSMQDIRLSQVHLADTAAQQQPEYYLVLPYQVGDKAHVLEWLLRKQARAAQQQPPDSWTFSLRFETQRHGPLLVKGSYTEAAADNDGAQALTKLRFYLQGENHSASPKANKQSFEQALEHFIQRLDKAGIANVKHEVHLGVVPTTLAPSAHELVQSKPSTRGPYG